MRRVTYSTFKCNDLVHIKLIFAAFPLSCNQQQACSFSHRGTASAKLKVQPLLERCHHSPPQFSSSVGAVILVQVLLRNLIRALNAHSRRTITVP